MMKPGPRTRFIPNPSGYRSLAERSLTGQAMLKRAEAIMAKTTPRMGGYERRLRAVRAGFRDQQGARVLTTWPFAHLEEWGSVNNPPYASMRRGIEKAGLGRKVKLAGKG